MIAPPLFISEIMEEIERLELHMRRLRRKVETYKEHEGGKLRRVRRSKPKPKKSKAKRETTDQPLGVLCFVRAPALTGSPESTTNQVARRLWFDYGNTPFSRDEAMQAIGDIRHYNPQIRSRRSTIYKDFTRKFENQGSLKAGK